MRRVLSVVVALVCVVVLSSCALLPGHLFETDEHRAAAQMKVIAAAINSHDAAALKALFSPRAVQQATDLDARLNTLLATFPNGLTWGLDSVPFSSDNQTDVFDVYVKVSADGKDYRFFFADYTRDVTHPDNVGIYALGITPWYEGFPVGPAQSFDTWAGAMNVVVSKDGYPGVYAGYDNSQLSRQTLDSIIRQLNSPGAGFLGDYYFSKYARTERATEIHDGIAKLIALFPDGGIIAPDEQAAPVVREKTDSGGRTLLLLSTYRISSGGVQYWLFCADFRENTDPNKLGIHAIGVAPRTASGDSAAEQALFSWAATFDVDSSTPPGILIPQ
jgi:hypothetical protein